MSLMEVLKNNFSQVQYHDSDNVKYHSTHWDFYKNDQKKDGLEYEYGYIAILIKLHFKPNKILEGVAFIEAKRIYQNDIINKKSYDSLKWDQLERMVSATPYHRVLLFDVDFIGMKGVNPLILTIPTQHVLSLRTRSNNLNAYCENFSQTLVERFFHGFELDYSSQIIEQVKGLTDKHSGVKFLAVAQVGFDEDVELNSGSVKINRSIYSKIGSTEPENRPRKKPGGGSGGSGGATGGRKGETLGGMSGRASRARFDENEKKNDQENNLSYEMDT